MDDFPKDPKIAGLQILMEQAGMPGFTLSRGLEWTN
jgi:hypothetical protein